MKRVVVTLVGVVAMLPLLASAGVGPKYYRPQQPPVPQMVPGVPQPYIQRSMPAFPGPMAQPPIAYRAPQWVQRPMVAYLPPPPMPYSAYRVPPQPYGPIARPALPYYPHPAWQGGPRLAQQPPPQPRHFSGPMWPPLPPIAAARPLPPHPAMPRWQPANAPRPQMTNPWRSAAAAYPRPMAPLPPVAPAYRFAGYPPIAPPPTHIGRFMPPSEYSPWQRRVPMAANTPRYRPLHGMAPAARTPAPGGVQPPPVAWSGHPGWSRPPQPAVNPAAYPAPRQPPVWNRSYPQGVAPQPVYRPVAWQPAAPQPPQAGYGRYTGERWVRRMPTIPRWGRNPYRSW